VTGSFTRVYYRTPDTSFEPFGAWGQIKFRVGDNDGVSGPGTVTIVPPSGIIVGSDFSKDDESWTVVGNKYPQSVKYERFVSRDKLQDFVYATDDVVNLPVGKPNGTGNYHGHTRLRPKEMQLIGTG